MADKQTVSIEALFKCRGKGRFILSVKDSEQANFIVCRSGNRNVGSLAIDELEKSPFF